ncbi:MAG: carboxypeptidase-like regulatory domain-containing protein, partial [Muribaculaceae bacterium]|nr:carboxypeptidase-like regulatory domain-containing protein [Muribaculaceae bacterium]
MRRLIPSLFVISALGLSSVYAATVKGRVLDSERQPLPGATLLLRLLPDSIRAAHTVADLEGFFSLTDLHAGDYLLTASMSGLEPATKRFEIADTSVVNLGDMILYENSVILQEAVVTGVRASIVAKQDTIEYNAGSFHTNPNANVEDLLKKLPGVEVGSDGTITSGGKTISKILVDGKEFFADDPQLATKNLPSDIVSKVQVIDRK